MFAELNSPQQNVHYTWGALSKHIEQRIDELRERIEGELDPIATATVRGQIRAFREILALAQPPARGHVANPA